MALKVYERAENYDRRIGRAATSDLFCWKTLFCERSKNSWRIRFDSARERQ